MPLCGSESEFLGFCGLESEWRPQLCPPLPPAHPRAFRFGITDGVWHHLPFGEPHRVGTEQFSFSNV